MQFNGIIMHHTGGAYFANATDLAAYHSITQGDGTTVKGKHPYSANAVGKRLEKGAYAPHTLNLNSGKIGKAIACMADGDWNYPRASSYFPRPAQVDAFLMDVAKDAKFYNIPITPRTVLTHAEVEITLGVNQRNKWDFDYDPYGTLETRDPLAIGEMMRDTIRRFMITVDSIRNIPPMPEAPQIERTLRQGMQGADVAEMQTMLAAHGFLKLIDGKFGPGTRRSLINFQKSRQLTPDGVYGRMTQTALRS